MNSCIESVLLFFKVCLAVCCGCNTIDIYKEEVNEYWHPIQEHKKLICHKEKLTKICSTILDKNYEKKFLYDQKNIDIEQIKEDINNLNVETIMQLKTIICNYYNRNYNELFF